MLLLLLVSGAGAQPMPGAGRAGSRPDSTDLGRAGGFRRPFWVMMRSVAVPGWGQAYNGRWFKAVLFGGVESAFIYGVVNEDHLAREASRHASEEPGLRTEWNAIAQGHRANKTDYIWWGAFTLLVSMGDAFVDAHLKGFNIEFKQAGDTTLTAAGAAPEMRLGYRVRFR